MSKEIYDRLAACESSNSKLKRVVFVQSALLGLLALALSISHANANRQVNASPSTLQVEELVIVDRQGVPRVRIGSDLPDAVINGKATPRGAKATGVMLYDTTGQERGGYLTFDNGNIALTLDSRQQQTALFVAGPDGAPLCAYGQRDSMSFV